MVGEFRRGGSCFF
ncbi:hypothetical protein CP061683_2196A, partial [Chlamydia psittaci 06-1683]